MDGDRITPAGEAEPNRAEERVSRPEPTENAASAQPPAEATAARRRSRLRAGLVGLVIVAILATAGTLYWLHARNFESTDDAFIDGHITQMASQIAGRVTRLLVDDNQHVDPGQALVQIDPRDYQVKLDQAQAQRGNAAAQVAQARAQVELQQANLDEALANVDVGQAELDQAQQDLARYKAIDQRAITRQQFDSATSTFRTKTAKLEANRQVVAASRAQIDAARAQVAAAEASLRAADAAIENAKLQLSYATITAPAAGRFTKRTVEVGNYVTPGQSLFAIVQDGLWVTANFKETQLARMRHGQPVDIRIDSFPGEVFRGLVDSFQLGTGAIFSSLPAENATGNYVKIVQRVPVKIVFDDERARDRLLAPGFSVVPTVTVR